MKKELVFITVPLSLTFIVFLQQNSVPLPNICSNGFADIVYLGDASPDANYIWDFNGGIAVPGTGQGPHEVTWPDGGIYNISLVVEENNCTSDASTQTVEVDTPLSAFEITCEPTTTSIEFFWNQINGAEDYTIHVLTGQTGTMTSDTSILFDSLNPNTIVGLEVIANSLGICGSSSLEVSCTANDCEPVDVIISSVNDICLDSLITPFELNS